jgi:hypothetical protein
MTESAHGRQADSETGMSSVRQPRSKGALRDTSAETASLAGIHDVLLGGRGHHLADCDTASELLRLFPAAVTAAYQNRRFLESAIDFALTRAGIRQFIDIGCGFFTSGAAHEAARRIAPTTRVVYVDRDPAVVSQLTSELAGHPSVVAILGDLRRPDDILSNQALLERVDLAKPVAIILTAVLHYVASTYNPGGIVAALTQAMAPGSQLVLSHAASEHLAVTAIDAAQRILEPAGAPFVPRSQAEITRFFDGLELVPPGVVNGAAWRPGYQATDPRRPIFYAGIGSKQ